MTVEVEAGNDWCFFVPEVYEYQTMDFEFQVKQNLCYSTYNLIQMYTFVIGDI